MQITRAGTHKSNVQPAANFTGRARSEVIFYAEPPGRTRGAYVTFEPGARTNWHTHALGQTILIVHGAGRVQRWGGPVETVRVGDVVFFEPGEKHWHGAGPDHAMTHLTVGEMIDGKSADWAEPVTDEQYNG